MAINHTACGRCAGCAGAERPVFCLYWRDYYRTYGGNVAQMERDGFVFTHISATPRST